VTLYVDSENRLTMLRAIWRALPAGERPSLLANCISDGGAPCRELMFIVRAMRECVARGRLLIAEPNDMEFYDGLPERVVVYRGTTQAELDDWPFFGVCWTTKGETAEWFAATHGRFRRVDSNPILLSQTVMRAAIAGVTDTRDEAEVFIDTSVTCRAKRAQELSVWPLERAALRERAAL
jgi:hypothetical protein